MIETYGVDMAGFDKEPGNAFIIANMIAPCVENIEETEPKIKPLTRLLEALKSTKAAVDQMRDARVRLSEAMATKLESGDPLVNTLYFQEEIDSGVQRDELGKVSASLDGQVEALQVFASRLDTSIKNYTADLADFEEFCGIWRDLMSFWNNLLDAQRSQYLIDKVDPKFVAKVCRDGHRVAKAAVEFGRTSIGRMTTVNGKKGISDQAVVTALGHGLQRAEKVMKFFANMKSAIDKKGVDFAVDSWKMSRQEADDKNAAGGMPPALPGTIGK